MVSLVSGLICKGHTKLLETSELNLPPPTIFHICDHDACISENWHQHFQNSWFSGKKKDEKNLSHKGNFNFRSLAVSWEISVSGDLEEERLIPAQRTLN